MLLGAQHGTSLSSSVMAQLFPHGRILANLSNSSDQKEHLKPQMPVRIEAQDTKSLPDTLAGELS